MLLVLLLALFGAGCTSSGNGNGDASSCGAIMDADYFCCSSQAQCDAAAAPDAFACQGLPYAPGLVPADADSRRYPLNCLVYAQPAPGQCDRALYCVCMGFGWECPL